MFNYYDKLSPGLKAVYRASDRVEMVPPLPDMPRLGGLAAALRQDLQGRDRARVSATLQALAAALARSFAVRTPLTKVLASRPVRNQSEYHGLCELAADGSPPLIKVWMYTSQQKRVVAYKTFLRTFLHEFCHHLDYEWLRLSDSLHTEGFFKRESSLFKQLLAADEGAT